MKLITGPLIVTCLWLIVFPCSFGRDVPPGLKIFYDEILDDPSGNGQNLTLIREAMAADWGQRPNPINAAEGTGKEHALKISDQFNINKCILLAFSD